MFNVASIKTVSAKILRQRKGVIYVNNFTGSGRLTRNAVLKGKVLLFTVAASDDFSKKVDFVPCTIFNVEEEVAKLLTEKGKGLEVELQGYVSTSRVQQNGTVKYFTRVIVNPESLTVLD